MIDITRETLRTLAEAAKALPAGRRGRPVHTATLCRWALRGIRGHRLEVVRLGGKVFTSLEALQRFADRLSGPAPASDVARPSPSAGATAADSVLQGMGF